MSEKTEDPGVLGSLPATRPTRFGGERGARGAKPKAANGKTTPAKPKATPSRPRAAAPAPTRPRAGAADAAPSPTPPRRPRPVRAGAPTLQESTERARTQEPRESGARPPSGTELVTTAIQAAGELAQIGLTVGGQVLKRAASRLRKP
jgi:hypothetical protein